MTLVTLLSTLAMLLGLGGIVPQLLRMLRARSAAGQAALGWGMGLAAHCSMAYVNWFGFGAPLLTASNVAAGSLCGVAIVLILTLRDDAPRLAVDDLPTQEFAALREAVLARDPRPRTCRNQPARPARDRGRTRRAAARTSRA